MSRSSSNPTEGTETLRYTKNVILTRKIIYTGCTCLDNSEASDKVRRQRPAPQKKRFWEATSEGLRNLGRHKSCPKTSAKLRRYPWYSCKVHAGRCTRHLRELAVESVTDPLHMENGTK